MQRPTSLIFCVIVGASVFGSLAVLRAQSPAAERPVSGEVNRYQTCTSASGTYLTDSTNGRIWILNPGPPIKGGKFTWSWEPQAEPVGK